MRRLRDWWWAKTHRRIPIRVNYGPGIAMLVSYVTISNREALTWRYSDARVTIKCEATEAWQEVTGAITHALDDTGRLKWVTVSFGLPCDDQLYLLEDPILT